MNGSFVTYYRVSTDKQGVRGLGMDAQRAAVERYLNGGNWTVLAEFEEVESGKRSDRPELAKAIALCKSTGAKLLIGKLDRLSRDMLFLLTLQNEGVQFVAADMPDANNMTLHMMMVFAQHERETISARTKAGLQAIKDRIEREGHHVSKAGNVITKLGPAKPFTGADSARGVQSRKAKADEHASKVIPTITLLKGQGATLQQIADHLNHMGQKTPRGASWTPIAVSRAYGRQKQQPAV
ncbi:recombinase family protein [Brevundimonas sp. NPDC058933]|uniref:recombinase family protein n=1 Tax=Brevundimonas sp. NPDC058933 TaxID=3346673 RepID=UPI003BEEF60A